MKELLRFTISSTSRPMSMNQAIREQKVSQAMRRRLRSDGTFICNGSPITWDTLLHPNDSITVFLESTSTIIPTPMDLSCIYEDDHLLVINKPSGLLMHPTASERYFTLANGIMHYFQEKGTTDSFHPVHRLDKDTSGLVIIAKNALVQHAFTKIPEKIQKVYDAIVDGIIPSSHITIHYPIARKEGSIIERHAHREGQVAHTDVMVLQRYAHHSHIRCYLHTGRTHQIRVHLSTLGFPLAGDDLYGGSLQWHQQQCLHASELHFIHPMSGTPMHLYASLPEYFYTIPK